MYCSSGGGPACFLRVRALGTSYSQVPANPSPVLPPPPLINCMRFLWTVGPTFLPDLSLSVPTSFLAWGSSGESFSASESPHRGMNGRRRNDLFSGIDIHPVWLCDLFSVSNEHGGWCPACYVESESEATSELHRLKRLDRQQCSVSFGW